MSVTLSFQTHPGIYRQRMQAVSGPFLILKLHHSQQSRMLNQPRLGSLPVRFHLKGRIWFQSDRQSKTRYSDASKHNSDS